MVGIYSVRVGLMPMVRVRGQARAEVGSGAWVSEMAAEALGVCRPGVPAYALVGLLDGVDEFAAMLRASQDQAWVEWAGPLSQYMSEPLRASRRELAARPTVTDFTTPIAGTVNTVLNGVAERVTVLVGGPGAAWPFVADALAGPGRTVWQSGDPTLDLAYGACWWERYRDSFLGEAAGPVRAAARTGVTARMPDGAARSGGRPDADLPWDRPPASASAAPASAAPAFAETPAGDERDPWE
jgi:hypothetical protein